MVVSALPPDLLLVIKSSMRDMKETGTWKIFRSMKIVKTRWVTPWELWLVLDGIIRHSSRVEFIRDWQKPRIFTGDQKRNRSRWLTTWWGRLNTTSTDLLCPSCVVHIRWLLWNLTIDQLGTESLRLFSERKVYLDHRQPCDDHHSMQHRIGSTNSDISIYSRFSCLTLAAPAGVIFDPILKNLKIS